MEIIARVPEPSLARSLIVALRAYGFHPADIEAFPIEAQDLTLV